jgi:hypothetical protein
MGQVHVELVVRLPEEGLTAGDVLDVVGVDAATVQDRVLVLTEVISHRPHDAHVAEEARCEREVHGGAAEHPLPFSEGRLDRVERDRSDYHEAHSGERLLPARPRGPGDCPRCGPGRWPTLRARAARPQRG